MHLGILVFKSRSHSCFLSLYLSHVCGGAAIIHPQGKNRNIYSWQIGRDKEFLSLQVKIWTESRHLVFWLLGTLTGL